MRRDARNQQKQRWEALKGKLNTASATHFSNGTQNSLPKGKPDEDQTVLPPGQAYTLMHIPNTVLDLVIYFGDL